MRAFEFWLVVLLLSSQWRLKDALPQDVLRIIEEKEALVNRLAKEAASLFRRRSEIASPCECSVSVCRAAASHTACEFVKKQLTSLCSDSDCIPSHTGPLSFVQTPPNIDTDDVPPETKESICLYDHMESILRQLDPHPLTMTRISTKDGTSRVYPGAEFRMALLENGAGAEMECAAMDPRRTAEYVGASVGPKDIVFVIDSSQYMAKPWDMKSNTSRLEAVSQALASMVDTLSSIDRVNLVAYSDKARRRGTSKPLFPGTPDHLYLIKSSIESLYPLGNSNLRDGIKLGFELLTESNRKRRRKSWFYKGQKVMVVITGSSNHGDRDGGLLSHSAFLRDLERRQKQLKAVTGVEATIFTYSIGENVDETLLKQIACASGGAWFPLDPSDDAHEVLNSHNQFLASTHGASFPVWTNFYRSRYGRGLRTTVAKAFHFRPGNGVPDLLLGVISHEVRLKDLALSNTTLSEIESALMRRSRRHDAVGRDVCQLQVFRNIYADGAICADQLPVQATKASSRKSRSRKRKRKKAGKQRLHGPPCFEHDDLYYKAFLEPMDWESAAVKCEEDGGALAYVISRPDLAFLAGMAPPDGAWVAARGDSKAHEFQWVSETGLSSVLPKIQSPTTNLSNICVSVDNRGTTENLDSLPCHLPLPYLCAYSDQKRCQWVTPHPKRGYFITPPLNLCIQHEEALADAGPTSAARFFPSAHLWCSVERPGDLHSMCCRSC